MNTRLDRRAFLHLVAASGTGILLPSCGGEEPDSRYTEADIAKLAEQWITEEARSGKGPFGELRYRGYRGLAELPWFEIDDAGVLRNVATDLPKAIDMHCHFGISMLMAPDVDLHARTDRVQHLLDCDGEDPGCPLDLDVYINRNFTEQGLKALTRGFVAQAIWGSAAAKTQTLPNLLGEMDATGVEQALILPIAFGLPFGDDLTERWTAAITKSGETKRLLTGASVHPKDGKRLQKLRRYAAKGALAIKVLILIPGQRSGNCLLVNNSV